MREAAAAGDPDAATLIGFWTMATAHHVEAPWFLTSLGKEMAGECPCGPCSWTDPPEPCRQGASRERGARGWAIREEREVEPNAGITDSPERGPHDC